MKSLNNPFIAAIVTAIFVTLCAYSYGYSQGYSLDDIKELSELQDAATHHKMTKGETRKALNELYGEDQ
jgi:uncharacterized membrane protein YjjP (DUF1212 family)